MKNAVILCVTLALLMAGLNASAQPMIQMEPKLQHLYPANAPGAAVLVVTQDVRRIQDGYGMVNLKTRKKITADSHFRMASVSKQFTAMCMLLLEAQGKVKLHDPVRKYLPSLPGFATPITLRHLLNHTSGIADYESLIPASQTDQLTDADVLRLVADSDRLYFTPGSQFKYSNTGFCLLTQVVEKVSGMPYPAFIERYIFEPLEMVSTTVYQHAREIPDRALGYHPAGSEWHPADQSLTSATMGDGSVYTSLNEYEKWIRMLWGAGSERLYNLNIAQATATQQVEVRDGLRYSNGWFIANEDDGSEGYFHSGESTGFRNIVYHNPARRLLIVVFSNAEDERIVRAFDELASAAGVRLSRLTGGESLFAFLSKIYEE